MTSDLPVSWILGSSRSGSTWLLRMLCDLEGTVGIDDPHLGHHLEVWRPIPLAWAAAEGEPELTTLRSLKRHQDDYFFSDRYAEAWRPALAQLIRTRFAAQAEAAGVEARRIVVKEPGSQAADLLLSLFPESTLIFLIRDGRDVVDSWLDAYQAGSWAERGGAFPVSTVGRLPLIRWLATVWRYRTEAVAAAYARHDPERRVVVRYESLLADTPRELGRIAAVLGEEDDPASMLGISDRHAFGSLGRRDRGNGKEARAASPGAWRENLTAAEQKALLDIVCPTLEELGYDIGREPPHIAAA